MRSLIATLYLGRHFVFHTGHTDAVQLPAHRFTELQRLSASGSGAPAWHADAVARLWGVGAAPPRRGDPGYRAGLDRDGDGMACES